MISLATRAFFQLVDELEMSDDYGQVIVIDDQVVFIKENVFEVRFFVKNQALDAVLVKAEGQNQQWYFVLQRSAREFSFLPTEVALRQQTAVSDISLEAAASLFRTLFYQYQTVIVI